MKKYVLDLVICRVSFPAAQYVLLCCNGGDEHLPEICPGQFAQLRIDRGKQTFLRRPISIHYVDYASNEISFLIQIKGEGTRSLASMQVGDILNAVLPLGNGFTLPRQGEDGILLVGGGVGVAPLLYMGKRMNDIGCRPTFLLGARSKSDLLLVDEFQKQGDVFLTTEDGSMGEKGYVTQHSLLQEHGFSRICVCGPKPMMMAVAKYAAAWKIPCEVSLENMMACGVGACLCCVEDIKERGHVCVCKEGPVFNINDLKWQI